MQAAEAIVLAGVVVALYWALTPLRRRIEAALRRRMPHTDRRRAQVIPLTRRRDGTYEREGGE